MNLEPTEEQRAIVEAMSSFLTGRMPVARFLPGRNAAADSAAWRELAELGWFGIAAPEEVGGSGLGLAEETLLYREAGRHLLTPTALATSLAVRLATAKGDYVLARQLVGGAARAALASAQPRAETIQLFDAEDASHVLCAGDGLALVTRAQLATEPEPDPLDETLVLAEGPRTVNGATIAHAPQDSATWAAFIVLTCAYLVGVAEAAQDTAVAYAQQREQFGKPVGSFQAIQHLCSEMAIQSTAAWAQTLFAALALEENGLVTEAEPVALDQVAAAQLLAPRTALTNVRIAVQVHGALGFTRECPAHLFVKRAQVMQQVLAVSSPATTLLDASPLRHAREADAAT